MAFREASADLAGTVAREALAFRAAAAAYAPLADECGFGDFVWVCPGGFRPDRFVAAGDGVALADGTATAPADGDDAEAAGTRPPVDGAIAVCPAPIVAAVVPRAAGVR
jgi:hypothetical protein